MDDRTWAQTEFGDVEVGDARLAYRLVGMAARAAGGPNGIVAKVFEVPRERQGAYDLLGNTRVAAHAVIDATARATARRCADAAIVRLVIDGTSASLADQARRKELGAIGQRRLPTRGLKIVDVCAVDDRGVPMGIAAMETWARGAKRCGSRSQRRHDGRTEMAERWLPALQRAVDVVRAHSSARLWVVGDRECDDARFLRACLNFGAYTVRAAQDRLVLAKGKRRKLFAVARAGKLVATRVVDLPATPTRKPRRAVIDVRIATVELLLPRYDGTNGREAMNTNVVELRERGSRRDRVQWTLLTNASIATIDDVDAVIASYRARWRIEEFHRAWKAGACDLEATQLRTREAITKWATILGAVAARAERLKYLSRTDPDAPATTELSDIEILALITAKRRIKTSVEVIPDAVPTIGVATRWIAELGCWTGQYRKKYPHPGTMVIARGLEKLSAFTEAVAAVLASQEFKRRLR